jgi:hypothetical protein
MKSVSQLGMREELRLANYYKERNWFCALQ